jgi:hypothetical protein
MLSKSPFDANLTQLIFNESKNALTKPIVRAFPLFFIILGVLVMNRIVAAVQTEVAKRAVIAVTLIL